MTFGAAIEAMRTGMKVSRAGWNGKGMYLYLKIVQEGYEPCIVMFTAQGKHQPGWLASQPDMLADDWSIIETAD